MGLSSNCCHSTIGSVSAEQRSVGAKMSGAEPDTIPAAGANSATFALARGRGTQAGQRHAAAAARSHSGPAASTKEAKRNDGHTHRAGPPEGRANATARDDTARDDTDVTSVHARTSSTHAPQRRVAGPTRPNRARGLFWCALSRGGASEGRIGAVVVFVWVTSAGAGWVVRRVDRTAVFVCRPKDAARHAWGASGLCA